MTIGPHRTGQEQKNIPTLAGRCVIGKHRRFMDEGGRFVVPLNKFNARVADKAAAAMGV